MRWRSSTTTNPLTSLSIPSPRFSLGSRHRRARTHPHRRTGCGSVGTPGASSKRCWRSPGTKPPSRPAIQASSRAPAACGKARAHSASTSPSSRPMRWRWWASPCGCPGAAPWAGASERAPISCSTRRPAPCAGSRLPDGRAAGSQRCGWCSRGRRTIAASAPSCWSWRTSWRRTCRSGAAAPPCPGAPRRILAGRRRSSWRGRTSPKHTLSLWRREPMVSIWEKVKP